jgi:hypothetical protein
MPTSDRAKIRGALIPLWVNDDANANLAEANGPRKADGLPNADVT